jgi:hypothetical protein
VSLFGVLTGGRGMNTKIENIIPLLSYRARRSLQKVGRGREFVPHPVLLGYHPGCPEPLVTDYEGRWVLTELGEAALAEFDWRWAGV